LKFYKFVVINMMAINKFAFLLYPLAFAFCLAWAVTGWLSLKTSSSSPASYSAPAKSKTQSAKLPDTTFIIKKNIFNAEVSAAEITTNSTENTGAAPVDSNFDGKLLGVLFGEDQAMAIISYKDKKYILRLDEEKDGLILEDVGYYHAVISKGGEKYKLILKSDKDAGSKGGSSVRVDSSGASETTKSKIPRKVVLEQLSDVNSVIKSVLIVPYERDGKFEGYRVRRMTNTSVLRKIGVEPNDVIMRLNGKSLDSPAVFFDALKNAENLSAITLDVLRGGKKTTIYVEIEG